MNKDQGALVDFLEYELQEISFKKNPINKQNITDEPNVNMELSITTQDNDENENLKKLILTITLSGQIEGKISLAGIFQLNGDLEHFNDPKAFEIIATSILLPYARSSFSFVSAIDGSIPFILPTINLNELFKNSTQT